MNNRWWIYQRERFPLAQHAPLVLAFSLSALIFSSLLREDYRFPEPAAIAVAFITALLFFLQLRIADEFKDHEEDCRYRPYRPVPRGLVKLSELRWLFIGCGLIQLALALLYHPPLVLLLGITWIYLAAMSKEFFVRKWLVNRPLIYLWSHMLIMPLIDLYATSCDWLVAGLTHPPPGIFWFLVVSFFNGILIEFGRKIRSPENEETGVNTYTALWGVPRAALAWSLALTANLTAALLAANQSGAFLLTLLVLLPAYLTALFLALRFSRQPEPRHAKWIELSSGLWTLLLYLTLGPLALLLLR
ncbi:MAG: UbiA family prenyltransferase [Opitutales bacterium]|nr:UbiA family prenyltransferase [Opitutales bacterium]MCH8540450.1 UbiA family prenyltransferase [Opitutales bacterium]